jgi:hypothetical protein
MNDLMAVETITQRQKLKTLVLDSVSSPITKRVHDRYCVAQFTKHRHAGRRLIVWEQWGSRESFWLARQVSNQQASG